MYKLTAKELEVLALVVEAKSNKEIASLRVTSDRTTESHVSNILGKTGCKNRRELIVLYFNEQEKFSLIPLKNKHQQIAELLDQGLRPSVIAGKVGTTVNYVYLVRQKINGI
jgi:DNA-binding CsgD family transcriptional regulator